MTYSTRLLVAFLLLFAVYPAAAGEWRYENDTGMESISAEAQSTQTQAQPMTVSSARRSEVGPVPINNMTMEKVQTKFGQPKNEAAPVGSPPIHRWYYDEYTVYFEFDRVIISVIN